MKDGGLGERCGELCIKQSQRRGGWYTHACVDRATIVQTNTETVSWRRKMRVDTMSEGPQLQPFGISEENFIKFVTMALH